MLTLESLKLIETIIWSAKKESLLGPIIKYRIHDSFKQLKYAEEQFLVAINLLLQNDSYLVKQVLEDNKLWIRIVFGEEANGDAQIIIKEENVSDLESNLETEFKRYDKGYICIEMCWKEGYFYRLPIDLLKECLEKRKFEPNLLSKVRV